MNKSLSLPTTFRVDPDGREEAYQFAFTLLLEGLSYEIFKKWPMEKQAEFAEGVARLKGGAFGLVKALQYVGRYQAAHADALQRYAEAKFGEIRN